MVPVTSLSRAAPVALAFVALAAWTWGGWPDVVMDFGRELYLAWRLAEGDVLYRDAASVYGPLSPYANAALFRLFGAGLRTLALANLAILAVLTALLASIANAGANSRWAGIAGALVFLPLCGFAQLVPAGSFNFVAPYAHEATHGLLLGTAAVFCALRFLRTRRLAWAAAAGAFCGLAFLTKPEGFVAALGACGAAGWLARIRPGGRPLRHAAAAFTGGLLVPPALAVALLAAVLPAREAWIGALGSWAHLGNRDLLGLPYFAWSLGTNDLGGNLAALLRAAGWQLLVLGPAAAVAFLVRARPRLAVPLAAGAVVIVLSVLGPTWRSEAWLQAARPLPLWACAAAVAGWAGARRARHDAAGFARHAARTVLAVFALLMLARIVLHARLYHYGFVLAAPAVFLFTAALVDGIPAALERRRAKGVVFRFAALAALAVAVAFHLAATHRWYAGKKAPVGAGADRFRADVRGAYVVAALQGLSAAARPGDTLVVLPEGVMLNYLLRLRTPVPYLTMLPTEISLHGEEALLSALERDPPTHIVLVHRDTSEYGPRLFGRDYGLRIAGWISTHYVRTGSAGDPPLRPGSGFGIMALRLRALPAAP